MNDLLLVPQENAKGYGLQTFTLDKSGLFQEQNQWFKEKQLIDYAIFQSMVLARTDQEILFANLNFSDPSIDWQESKLSGNFVPNLDQFVTANSQIFIPSGSYGVEVLELQEVIESPERRVLPNRRNASQSEDWQSVETSRLRIFDTEFTPVLFSTLNSSGWKFRPDSIFEADVIELDASWKKSPWFGNFYERGYPWVYHSKLGWSYVQENTTGEFWLWRSETGWTWSSNEIFPHLFSDSLRGWVYFDINEDRKKLRIYDFTTMHWREE